MKLRKTSSLISQILCTLLIVVMAISITGCSEQHNSPSPQNSMTQLEGGNLGEGAIKFTFTVVDQKHSTTEFEISTDQKTVGDALLELNLIAGEKSEYGLYVKTVNGITVDYDKDGKYWAFYVNDGYAMSGVDTTHITEGDTYSFRIE